MAGPGQQVRTGLKPATDGRHPGSAPKLIAELGITSVLDIPCGDMNWLQHVDLGSTRYIGADIVESLLAFNTLQYASATREFHVLDLA